VPADPVLNVVGVPGDKSLAHRALILAGLADGTSHLTNVPEGADVQCTLTALAALGVEVTTDASPAPLTTLVGARWRSPAAPIDCGNSGTLARLLLGALAGEGVEATLVGDASLSRRPMKRLADPLAMLLGAPLLELSVEGTLPARVLAAGGAKRRGPLVVDTHAPSAQVKSALLLAARHIEGEVRITEPVPTRDHTERMLEALGVEIDLREGDVWLYGPMTWRGFDLAIAGDPSSAAFLAAWAAMTGAALIVDDLLLNGRRLGFFRVLTTMGVRAGYEPREKRMGEAVGRVRVQAGSPNDLHGTTVPARQVPDLIDEVPALAALALVAKGPTRVPGLAELRLKESDRLARLVEMAAAFGGRAHVDGDALVIDGEATARGRVSVRTDGDHRIAMAAHLLGRVLDVEVELDAPGCERTSFPRFLEVLDGLAAKP
jgi:3-phosphoshikimate 1-carboxyvinyltransferase